MFASDLELTLDSDGGPSPDIGTCNYSGIPTVCRYSILFHFNDLNHRNLPWLIVSLLVFNTTDYHKNAESYTPSSLAAVAMLHCYFISCAYGDAAPSG
jgi:hypothetical protein